MGAISLGVGDCRLGSSNHHHHQAAATAPSSSSKSHRQSSGSGNDGGVVVDEIEGLIRVYGDGRVERPPLVKEMPATWSPIPGVASVDVVIDSSSSLSARVHVPTAAAPVGSTSRRRLPVVVYFHGGGFCVGSAAWSCYHEFLSRLALTASCAVVSVNYRLAPEHRLPAAFDDGQRAVKWILGLQRRDGSGFGEDDPAAGSSPWWASRCDFTRVFLAGDSAGATIAHNVASRLAASSSSSTSPRRSRWFIKGTVLIQPFFGGEARTWSERCLPQPPGSALTLPASDAYWRMSLPVGATRDHPWCNPLLTSDEHQPHLVLLRGLPPALVCVAETDMLRDRTAEFCRAVRRAGGSVEQVVHAGVGHAFHVLHVHGSRVAQARTHEMLAHINSFIDRHGNMSGNGR